MCLIRVCLGDPKNSDLNFLLRCVFSYVNCENFEYQKVRVKLTFDPNRVLVKFQTPNFGYIILEQVLLAIFHIPEKYYGEKNSNFHLY